jgi:hypothetical protein
LFGLVAGVTALLIFLASVTLSGVGLILFLLVVVLVIWMIVLLVRNARRARR